jgi:hypothetical protein
VELGPQQQQQQQRQQQQQHGLLVIAGDGLVARASSRVIPVRRGRRVP